MSVEAKREGNRLVIVCEIHQGVPSRSSGKNLVVATTSGFVQVPNTDLKFSLNVIKPRS